MYTKLVDIKRIFTKKSQYSIFSLTYATCKKPIIGLWLPKCRKATTTKKDN